MVPTPTYHAFDMHQVHYDALKLPVHVEGEGLSPVPVVTASASEDENRRIHVSLTNIDPKNEQNVQLDFRGASPMFAGGKIIASENMQDHNTFKQGDKVAMKELDSKGRQK